MMIFNLVLSRKVRQKVVAFPAFGHSLKFVKNVINLENYGIQL